MTKHIIMSSKKIFFDDSGAGESIILIHGYLESSAVWKKTAERLSSFSRVISIDLPGHGKSEVISDCSMNTYADSINETLAHLQIEKAVIVGHSMGGYAALAFAEKYQQKTMGLCLFHSTPFADSDDKKMQRELTIKRIQNGAYEDVVDTHVSAIFAEENVAKFQKEISENKQEAMQFPTEGVCESLRAMMTRNDNSELLKNLQIPLLYIYGRNDRFIPKETFLKIQFPGNSIIEILENSGHAGFIEEPNTSVAALKRFADYCRQ
jgi:pimeloyl-ACP methyl ester carboxylesterase